jgi:EmrB/QacA subfamily drug resistance transporter
MIDTPRPWAALGALCIGFFMIMVDTTIVNVAIPAMLTGLDATLTDIIWVNSVYLLTFAVPLLLTGRLGDRYGPKRLFVGGLVVFTLASALCGLADSAALLIAARAVQGLGAAMMTPQTMTFITRLFPPNKRGAPMGLWGGVAGIATIVGPVLGGVLVETLGWEWIFWVNVPVGVVGLVLALWLVPDWRPGHSHSFDPLGILLSGVGLFAVVFGLQEGQRYEWGSIGPISIPLLIGVGVALLVLFVWWQARNRHEPLLPLGLFRNWNFSMGTLGTMAIGFAITGMFLPLVIYVQSVLGFSGLESGLLTAPMSLVSGVVAPFAGRLSDRVNAKWVVAAGFAALAVGTALVAVQAQPTTNAWTLVPALLVCGVGIGLVFSPLTNLTTHGLDPRLIGAGSGVYNTARQVGGVIGAAAVGVLLQARLSVELPAQARALSGSLPENYRQPFVDGFEEASKGSAEFTSSTSFAPPPGVPADVADRLQALGHEVFTHAFTSAAKASLLLPIAAMLLGVVAMLAARRATAPPPPPPEPREPASATSPS